MNYELAWAQLVALVLLVGLTAMTFAFGCTFGAMDVFASGAVVGAGIAILGFTLLDPLPEVEA